LAEALGRYWKPRWGPAGEWCVTGVPPRVIRDVLAQAATPAPLAPGRPSPAWLLDAAEAHGGRVGARVATDGPGIDVDTVLVRREHLLPVVRSVARTLQRPWARPRLREVLSGRVAVRPRLAQGPVG
jgi:hypothetical protein